jgi:hypothetical protein
MIEFFFLDLNKGVTREKLFFFALRLFFRFSKKKIEKNDRSERE